MSKKSSIADSLNFYLTGRQVKRIWFSDSWKNSGNTDQIYRNGFIEKVTSDEKHIFISIKNKEIDDAVLMSYFSSSKWYVSSITELPSVTGIAAPTLELPKSNRLELISSTSGNILDKYDNFYYTGTKTFKLLTVKEYKALKISE